MSETDLFTPEVVAAVMAHMNDDHADDALLIVRGLGAVAGATSARMSGMDADGIDFSAETDGGHVPVRVRFSGPVTERPQIRREVVGMYERACAALGIPPRTAH
jgi:putative heme iron utilization protein